MRWPNLPFDAQIKTFLLPERETSGGSSRAELALKLLRWSASNDQR
jgi:hypothetical protein